MMPKREAAFFACRCNPFPINGLVLLLIIVFSAPPLWADEPSATPYRPTVSNPAALPVPGWLEIEAGLARSNGGEQDRRFGIPYLIKYAFNPDWGVLLGGELYARSTDFTGDSASGLGDTFALLKHRFAASPWENIEFGFEAGANFPTAKNQLGSGKTDYLLNGIMSIEAGEYDLDVNLAARRLGAVENGDSRTEGNWAIAMSRTLDSSWGVAIEFSGTFRRDARPDPIFLTAITYAVNSRVVLDAGFNLGLADVSPDWSVFAGATILVGKVR